MSPLSVDSALMIIYLLSGSWIPLLLSVLRYTSLHPQHGPTARWKDKAIPLAFTFQGFVLCGLVVSVLYSGSTYGSDAACNDHRILAFFHPYPATMTTRALAMVGFGALPVGCVLAVMSGDVIHAPRAFIESVPGSIATLVVLMSLWITNVELLRIYNNPQSGEESWISFG
jgi:hypothetical protein